MTTNPINPRHTPNPASGRTAEGSASATRVPHCGDPCAPAARADRIELSEAARALHEQITRDLPPASQLPPARIGEMLRRLNQGFYEKPEVVDTVLERLSLDL